MREEVWLSDRGVIRVAGADAASFLQGLLTNDVEKLEPGALRFAALLSPQGKILVDLFVHRHDAETFWLDAPAERVADLLKRLRLYKLRAKVEIAEADLAVVASADGAPADPRHPALGGRRVVAPAEAPAQDADARAGYEARRIAAGAPSGGVDFAYGDAFPHDANMDLLNGVDFAKGCYVGQEVVSRMKHRGEARKRVVRVRLDGPPPPAGAPVLDGEKPVGALGGSAGAEALALLRLDRVAEAEGRPLTAEGVRLEVLR